MYGTCKDLFTHLLHYQNFLNVLRDEYLNRKNEEEIVELKNSLLYVEIKKNYSVIDEIYELIKSNEFSSKICISGLMEAEFKLKEEYDMHDHEENQRVYLKFLMNTILEKIVKINTQANVNHVQKEIIESVISKLLFMNDQIFEMNLNQRNIDKFKSYAGNVEENLKEFRLWYEHFYKSLEDKIEPQDKIESTISKGVWQNTIEKVREEIEDFNSLKDQLGQAHSDIEKLEENINLKNKGIEKANKVKMNLDSKIFKLQTKVMTISIIELELQNLKKIEKNQQKQISELMKYKEDISRKSVNSEVNKENDLSKLGISKKFQKLANFKFTSNSLFKKNGRGTKSEYEQKDKFEINSLNTLLSSVVNQLNDCKSKLCGKKLEKIVKNTPNFQRLLNKSNRRVSEKPLISGSINFIRKNNFLIKKQISSLKIIDQKKEDINQQIENFFKNKNNIFSFYRNSKKVINKSIKKNEFKIRNYKIDYKREIERRQESKLNSIYGKLRVMNENDVEYDEKEENLPPLLLNLELK